MQRLISLLALTLLLNGCTLSFTNVSTIGEASDVIDNDQKADPNIAPQIEIPVKGI